MAIPLKTIARLEKDSRVTLVYSADSTLLTITLSNPNYSAMAAKTFKLLEVDKGFGGQTSYNNLKAWLGPACKACRIEGLVI